MLLTDIIGIEERKYGVQHFRVDVLGQSNNKFAFNFGSQQVSQQFMNILRSAIEQAKATSLHSQGNAADRLRELARLLKEGLINDAEFEQKRKEFLGQL